MVRPILMSAIAVPFTLVSAFAGAAAEEGDILVRARIIGVMPTEDSSGVNPTFPDATVGVENAFVPELDFTYFITDRIAAELILATSPHELEGEGELAAVGSLGDTWVLPPTLTLQYHFSPGERLRPYAGVGINYTLFYNESASGALEDTIGNTSIDLDDSFGFALQVGVDYDLNDVWFVNADLKYIEIDTTATLVTHGLVNEVDVELDPFVVGVGIGTRF